MFPLPLEQLSSRRVLAIAIPRAEPQTAHIFTGHAWAIGDKLRVADHGRAVELEFGAQALTAPGFNPRALARIFKPRTLPLAAWELDLVEACVALFVDEAPKGGIKLDDALMTFTVGEHGQPAW